MSADRGVTRQEERYVIWFGLLLGGIFNIRRRSLALAGPPKSAKNRGGGVHLFKTVRLIGRILYLYFSGTSL